ncbi:hypothetical protein OC846_002482 [Tilletia horrida]|uniref:Aminotransferase class I/classII large domain-containing protein n=1 Tax=Tilletia horrida TaxID=155126 RepID=A0AAN6GTK9_9BASI|nr:hypothetical protein OC845_001902 [Tilletia horrida]KAK0553561.1 hypothetical protein OC846_002482 [Tilletia horrida]
MLADQIRDALARRRARSTLRALTVHDTTARRIPDRVGEAGEVAASSSAAPTLTSDDQRLVDFSSNDYLSLASSQEMRQAFVQRVLSASSNPLGSTGSRLLDGNSVEHEQLEQRLAHFFQASSALFFGSGFEANVSIFSTLPQPGDLILYDELIHASVHDGMRQSRAAHRIPFRHNDLGHLERLLKGFCTWTDQSSSTAASCSSSSSRSNDVDAETCARFALALQGRQVNVFVAVESVYSMDGDICPLPALLDLVERHVPQECLHVVVDEAHSTGIYGPGGRGLCAELGVHGKPNPYSRDRVRVRLATFGKACGASGAAVLCDPLLREYMINYARPFIFSTAPPQAVVMAAHSSLDMLEREDVGGKRRRLVVERTQELLDGLRRIAGDVAGSEGSLKGRLLVALVPSLASTTADPFATPHPVLPPSPIVPLLTPHPRQLSAYLRSRGFLVRPISYPTVPLGQDRVRICLHSANTKDQVGSLCTAVRDWVEERSKASATISAPPASPSATHVAAKTSSTRHSTNVPLPAANDVSASILSAIQERERQARWSVPTTKPRL